MNHFDTNENTLVNFENTYPESENTFLQIENRVQVSAFYLSNSAAKSATSHSYNSPYHPENKLY